MTQRKERISSLESYALKNEKSGFVFFSNKPDKSLTALAGYFDRKITTERMILISNKKNDPQASNLTKITIL